MILRLSGQDFKEKKPYFEKNFNFTAFSTPLHQKPTFIQKAITFMSKYLHKTAKINSSAVENMEIAILLKIATSDVVK